MLSPISGYSGINLFPCYNHTRSPLLKSRKCRTKSLVIFRHFNVEVLSIIYIAVTQTAESQRNSWNKWSLINLSWKWSFQCCMWWVCSSHVVVTVPRWGDNDHVCTVSIIGCSFWPITYILLCEEKRTDRDSVHSAQHLKHDDISKLCSVFHMRVHGQYG